MSDWENEYDSSGVAIATATVGGHGKETVSWGFSGVSSGVSSEVSYGVSSGAPWRGGDGGTDRRSDDGGRRGRGGAAGSFESGTAVTFTVENQYVGRIIGQYLTAPGVGVMILRPTAKSRQYVSEPLI